MAKYQYIGQGMPRQGRTYLLFLKRNQESDDYKIITGYELQSGKVSPLDVAAAAASGNKKWASDVYNGADQIQLLADLQKEINNPSQKIGGVLNGVYAHFFNRASVSRWRFNLLRRCHNYLYP